MCVCMHTIAQWCTIVFGTNHGQSKMTCMVFLTLDQTLQVAHLEKWVDNPANIYMRIFAHAHISAFPASAWPSLFLTLEKPRWFIWRSESIILPPLFYLLAAEKEQLRTFGRWCTAKFCWNNSVHPLVVWINIARVQNCPDITKLSFCLFVFLSFCLFVFLSFCLFAFLSFCRHHSDQMFEGSKHSLS